MRSQSGPNAVRRLPDGPGAPGRLTAAAGAAPGVTGSPPRRAQDGAHNGTWHLATAVALAGAVAAAGGGNNGNALATGGAPRDPAGAEGSPVPTATGGAIRAGTTTRRRVPGQRRRPVKAAPAPTPTPWATMQANTMACEAPSGRFSV